ncbi:hypothetical protein RI367_000153 [Sorochytrium milnesiophthora]
MPAAVGSASADGGMPMDFDGDASENGQQPVSSFQSLSAEGDILSKQSDYRKAVEAYSKALNMRPTDKNCLVARSRCYLQLGESDLALADAEAALKEDPEFFKGMLQKAEAMYLKGDFEMALVFYHRGNKLRPELDEFRLGIQKAREAIDNSIGNPRDYKFKPPPTLSQEQGKKSAVPAALRSALGAKGGKAGAQPAYGEKRTKSNSMGGAGGSTSERVVVSTSNNTKKVFAREPATSASSEKTVKQLLGELYADKEYLEQLLNDRDFINNPNDAIHELVSDGLKYLEARTEFWRQQKPIYARRKEASQIKSKMSHARQRQMVREQEKQQHLLELEQAKQKQRHEEKKEGKRSSSPHARKEHGVSSKKTTAAALYNDITDALKRRSYDQVLSFGQKFMTAGADSPEEKEKLLVHVYSAMGAAYMESGDMPMAEETYQKALNCPVKTPEVESSVLGQLGRVTAKQRKFPEAIAYWQRKLACSAPIQPVEKAWLYHDLARCYIEMGDQSDKVETLALQSQACADEANDIKWQLNAAVLLGQVYSKKDPGQSAKNYKRAQELAQELNDSHALTAVAKALGELTVSA